MIDVDMLEVAIRHGVKIGKREAIIKSDIAIELITRLREAEKDAARYRWLVDNSVFGMKQNGASWSLSFDGPAPEHSGKIGECIDQAMKEKGDE